MKPSVTSIFTVLVPTAVLLDLSPVAFLGLACLGLGSLSLAPSPAQAQLPGSSSIVPARDGTGSQVQRRGNELVIEGGSRSGDRANLFHSFERFDVAADEIATFRAAPEIQTIIGRVLGGNASRIDGLLRVTQGNSHLLLINPAGIVTGLHGRILSPGGFTATTADRLGFGPAWLDSLATPQGGDGRIDFPLRITDYGPFNGMPTQFEFGQGSQGMVLNEGAIAVDPGQALRLLSNSVINTGQLTAPGGEITLLGLRGGQVAQLGPAQLGPAGIAVRPSGTRLRSGPALPLPLPQLGLGEATRLEVGEDGTLRLEGMGVPHQGALVGGALSVAGQAGGQVRVLGDRLTLRGAQIDASGGGQIHIGGAFRGGEALPQAQVSWVDARSVLIADGSAQGAANPRRGDGGDIVVWSSGSTTFWGEAYARGGPEGGDGGNIEISGRQNLSLLGYASAAAPQGSPGEILLDPETILIVDLNQLVLPESNNDNQLDVDQPPGAPGGEILAPDPGERFVISKQALEQLSGNIRLEASADILLDASLSELNLPRASQTTFVAGNEFLAQGSNQVIRTFDPTGNEPSREGSITIQAGRITGGSFNAGNPDGNGLVSATAGDVTLRASGDIRVGQLLGRNLTLASDQGNLALALGNASEGSRTLRGQLIELTAPEGRIDLDGSIQAGEFNRAEAGQITLTAQQFRAINPFATTALANANQDLVPMSLWAFPANVLDSDSIAQPPDPPLVGRVEVTLADGIPRSLGEGAPLIRIVLSQADRFTVAQGVPLGGESGTAGGIGLALSRIPPNVDPIALDNEFTSLETLSATVEALLLDELQLAEAICPEAEAIAQQPASVEEEPAPAPLLQALALAGAPRAAELQPEDLGLSPLEGPEPPSTGEQGIGEVAEEAIAGQASGGILCGPQR